MKQLKKVLALPTESITDLLSQISGEDALKALNDLVTAVSSAHGARLEPEDIDNYVDNHLLLNSKLKSNDLDNCIYTANDTNLKMLLKKIGRRFIEDDATIEQAKTKLNANVRVQAQRLLSPETRTPIKNRPNQHKRGKINTREFSFNEAKLAVEFHTSHSELKELYNRYETNINHELSINSFSDFQEKMGINVSRMAFDRNRKPTKSCLKKPGEKLKKNESKPVSKTTQFHQTETETKKILPIKDLKRLLKINMGKEYTQQTYEERKNAIINAINKEKETESENSTHYPESNTNSELLTPFKTLRLPKRFKKTNNALGIYAPSKHQDPSSDNKENNPQVDLAALQCLENTANKGWSIL